jgi:hypothetical protein
VILVAVLVIHFMKTINNTNCKRTGRLNDLWKYDGNYWTWMSGANVRSQNGSYGQLGIPDESNMPASRGMALGWTDLNGNFWLFGGVASSKTKDYANMNCI